MNVATRQLGMGMTHKGVRLSGPFNGKPLFSTVLSEGRISVSTTVAKTISGSIPDVHVDLPTAAIALAMQSAYVMFVRMQDAPNGILQAIEELFISLQELQQNKSILGKHTHSLRTEKVYYR